jgi:hypothetical protein
MLHGFFLEKIYQNYMNWIYFRNRKTRSILLVEHFRIKQSVQYDMDNAPTDGLWHLEYSWPSFRIYIMVVKSKSCITFKALKSNSNLHSKVPLFLLWSNASSNSESLLRHSFHHQRLKSVHLESMFPDMCFNYYSNRIGVFIHRNK